MVKRNRSEAVTLGVTFFSVVFGAAYGYLFVTIQLIWDEGDDLLALRLRLGPRSV